MTCAGRSRRRSLALPVSARTCRTWSSGNVLAITPRLMWSLTRTPAGKPAAARAIAANPARDSRQRTPSSPLTEQHCVYTVMSGVFYIGLGEEFDGDKVRAYPPGSVIVL